MNFSHPVNLIRSIAMKKSVQSPSFSSPLGIHARCSRRRPAAWLAALGLVGLICAGLAAGIKDSESASHGDEAASYQIVQTYEQPGFTVRQFQLAVLSHYAYLLSSGKEALVIDPGRDINALLAAAKQEGLTIRGVYLTHSHADFVAGHLELAKAVNCPVYVNEMTKAAFPHEPLRAGSAIKVGEAEVRILLTPGHTPDGTCGLVWSQGKPRLMFTGDTLFVGSVGRPDLLEGTMSAAQLAGMGYDTWMNQLSKLPDEIVILPAHGAGSLCGAHLRDEPSSTIGTERASNPYFQHRSKGAFIAAVLEGLPEAPQYFAHNAALNRQGPPLVDWQAPLDQVAAEPALSDIAQVLRRGSARRPGLRAGAHPQLGEHRIARPF